MTRKQLSAKKVINETVEEVSPYDLGTTLERLLEQVNEWIIKYGLDADFDWDSDHWEPYHSSPSPRFNIKKKREETSAEYEKRIQEEDLRKNSQETREREEFERLQRKFGGKK
jgi:hypothetical protein